MSLWLSNNFWLVTCSERFQTCDRYKKFKPLCTWRVFEFLRTEGNGNLYQTNASLNDKSRNEFFMEKCLVIFPISLWIVFGRMVLCFLNTSFASGYSLLVQTKFPWINNSLWFLEELGRRTNVFLVDTKASFLMMT